MKIEFFKYQGTGNDFVIIDNRNLQFDSSNIQLVSFLCDRRFGIGADGLMLLENHPTADFTMRYFNSDGKEATMCGNGGRCIAAFAVHLNIIKNPSDFIFEAVDGKHEAKYDNSIVSIKMTPVNSYDTINEDYFMDTGSPHYVQFITNSKEFPVFEAGKTIRYSEQFKEIGTNVNFVEILSENHIQVRTYERGVEDETLACGTGCVASAISTALRMNSGNNFDIDVLGGKLNVSFTRNENTFKDIWLTGPATFVFKGEIDIN